MKKKAVVVVPLIKAPTPRKNPKNPGALAPMPQLIKPAMPAPRNRRLMDSALGVRPTADNRRPGKDDDISKLPIDSIESLRGVEAELSENPATSRSSAVLSLLEGLNSTSAEAFLDQIIEQTESWTNESVVSLDFRVYHLLTQTLFTRIRQDFEEKRLTTLMFKSLAVCVKVMPSSDRVPLSVVLQVLYDLSQDEAFDGLFRECGILVPLMNLALADISDIGNISMMAAAILRHVTQMEENADELVKAGVIKRICDSLRTDRRRQRFTEDRALWVYQVVGMFSSVYSILDDPSDLHKYRLPKWLLDLTTLYSTDIGLRAAIAKAFAQLMMVPECVEVIEDEDLTPFFILLESKVPKIVNFAALALANAMCISEMISDAIADMPPPFGVYSICEGLKTAMSLDLKVSFVRCLAKCSETKPGIDTIQLFMQYVVPLLDTEMDILQVWSADQILVANVLIIIKNLAIIDQEKAADCVRDRMNDLMVYGIMDYVIDLMRVLLKSDTGKEVCEEVRDIEEVRLVLGDF